MAHSNFNQRSGKVTSISGTTGNPSLDKRMTDPRWQRTRERLLKVGFELVGEAGAEGVSIDNIIACANVSKQTFYNHFADRDAFTDELWLESRNRFKSAITHANAGVVDPVQRLARGVALYARLAIDDPSLARFVANTHVRRSMIEEANQGLERDLRDGAEQGRLRVETISTAAMFVTGVTWTLIAQILKSHDAVHTVTLCRETLMMLLRALGCRDDAERIANAAAKDMMGEKLFDH